MVRDPINTQLFANQYRVDTARAKWCEYFQGIYHIIICTKSRRHYFGEIKRDETTHKNVMHFSKIGQFVENEIPKIIEHKWYAHAPVWAVMPDHIHILMLIDVRGRLSSPSSDIPSPSDIPDMDPTSPVAVVEPLCPPPLRRGDDNVSSRMSEITPKIGSLAVVIRDFKSAVTRYANANHIPFAWQTSYYDHVIFDQTTLDHVIRYIENNVQNWSNATNPEHDTPMGDDIITQHTK